MKFDDHGIGAIIGHFEAQRWRARLSAIGFGALFALVLALGRAPLIAAPIDRLLRAARAQGSGHPEARVGRVRGFGDMRELAVTFDQMADNLGQQDQLRRDLVADVVHELRTPADATALREDLVPGARLVVIGGGFVGAEVASTARSLGLEVTIVEAAPAPVARILGAAVGRLLRGDGGPRVPVRGGGVSCPGRWPWRGTRFGRAERDKRSGHIAGNSAGTCAACPRRRCGSRSSATTTPPT